MKTIATARDKENMIALLNRFWYTHSIRLIGETLPFEVHNAKGRIEGLSIVKHRDGLKCVSA